MDKYTLLELTILEERIGARIPQAPLMPHPMSYPPSKEQEIRGENEIRQDEWREKYKKEQNALNKIKVEISKRLDEVINAE